MRRATISLADLSRTMISRSALLLGFLPGLGFALLACQRPHQPAALAEAPPRKPGPVEVLDAHPRDSQQTEGERPLNSTGIVLLRPPAPHVELEVSGTDHAAAASEAMEPEPGDPDVLLLRDPWPNPVGRGGLEASDLGYPLTPIYFGYDSFDLDYSARLQLHRYRELMQNDPELHMTLEGHCDERGSSEYNYNLAMARAWSVRELLIGLGIASDRLFAISYGEEQPVAEGSSPQAWALNRRVEIRPFYPVQDGQFLSSLKEPSPEASEEALGPVPPPRRLLEPSGEAMRWPPLQGQ